MKKTSHNAYTFIRKVYTLAKPYGRKKVALVTTFSFAQGFFQVLGVTSIFPFLALAADPSRLLNSDFGREVLDVLPSMTDNQLLLSFGLFAIIMLILANGVNLASEFIRTRYAHGYGHWLRSRLLRHIALNPYSYFLGQNSGVLIKKVAGDVMQYTTGVLLPLLDSIARLITILLLVATLFLVHPQIALAASAGFGLFYVTVFKIFGKWRKATTSGLRSATRGLFREAQQMLGGIKTVKVHRAEERFIANFSDHSHKESKLIAWVAIISNGPRYLIEPLAFGGLVLAVLIYNERGQDIVDILPNLGVMALAGYRLLPALQLLYGQLNQLNAMSHTLQEVYDEFETAEKTTEVDQETANGQLLVEQPLSWSEMISLEDLTFQYPDAKAPVIANLNLSIRKNSSLGIVGTTGSGKSTLVDLILGLHMPTSGKILIDHVPLTLDNRRSWRATIGYVPQEIFLIDDTIAANVAFGVPSENIDQTALEHSARVAQILDFIENETPQGWETMVGERGVRLSGGQRQRIGLARALYHQPDLLIFDEATSALDQETEESVMHAITKLAGSCTMIIVAHRLGTISHCEQKLDLSSVKHGS